MSDNQEKNPGAAALKAQLEEENTALKAQLEEAQQLLNNARANGHKIAVPVPGTFTVVAETADGKKVSKTYRFKHGRIRCPLAHGIQVSSAALIRHADGKSTEEDLRENPELAKITSQAAADRLRYLASIGASYLEEVA